MMKMSQKKQIKSHYMRIKRFFQDIIKSFRTEGFKRTISVYWKQLTLIIAVICVVIGMIMLINIGIDKLNTGDALDANNVGVTLSDKSYIPKEITFVKNKSAGEIIKDTHGDIVIECIGDVSKSETAKLFGSGDIYVHYTFVFPAEVDECNSFDGTVPYVSCSGTNDGDLIILEGKNKIKIDGKWVDIDNATIGMGRTYDCYAVFDTQDANDLTFQFVNADGNITNLKIAE